MASPGLGVHGASPSSNDWRVLFLGDIGAPVTKDNLAALQAWALSESPYQSTYGTYLASPAAYNPLAITVARGVSSVGDINSAGVKRFESTQAGALATANFMKAFGYGPVIQALRDSDPAALYQAVNNSGWCRGCEGGSYPVALKSFIDGGSVQGGTASFSGSTGSSFGQLLGVAKGSQGGAGTASSGDKGGLFGTCQGSTGHGGISLPVVGQVTPNLFSTPSVSGIGCYLEQSIKFIGFTAGGALLILVGAGLVVLPSLRGKAGALAPLLAGGAGIGEMVAAKAGMSTGVGAAASTTAKVDTKALAEQRKDELHAERLKQQKEKSKRERLRTKQERLATGSSASLSANETARIKRAQSGVGNRGFSMSQMKG